MEVTHDVSTETASGETSISSGIRTTEHKAAYDASCKRLLSEKVILARIMKGCLEEYKDCDVNDIAEKYIEGTPVISQIPVLPDELSPIVKGSDTADKSVNEGLFNYDIRFEAIAPGSGEPVSLIINVEAQNNFNPGYPLHKRAVYYLARMISAQYGTVFTNSHYEKIRKVYSIWVCARPDSNWRNTITRYRMVEENLVGNAHGAEPNYDLLTFVMICLGGDDAKNSDEGLVRMLRVLLSSELSAERKKTVLQDEYGIAMSQNLREEVSQMCNLSDGVYDDGLKKGIAQGMAQGVAQTVRSMVAFMFKEGLPDETVARCSGLSLEEVRKLRQELALA